MREEEIREIRTLIADAAVVSFDVFDTLLFRKVNSPETIFDLVGNHFGIRGFRKLRMEMQDEASRRVYQMHGYPHADLDEIYEVLAEHTEYAVDWKEVQTFELQAEEDALVSNPEMLAVFKEAKAAGKRIVAVSDMYIKADVIRTYLEKNGYTGIGHVYCSADEHKAKFNRLLFEAVAQKEGVPYEKIVHIGDNPSADVEIPSSFGIRAYRYEKHAGMEQVSQAPGSQIDLGLYRILYQKTRGFWYNLGIEAGGPLYLGLFLWLTKRAGQNGKPIYFLSRDGYMLHRLFQKAGYGNARYLYVSRRALLLAGITKMDAQALELLPPYTRGQTVGEILTYLCIDHKDIAHLKEAGFKSFDDIIQTDAQILAFQTLYTLDADVFLARCAWEREHAVAYLEESGFFGEDADVFDCGWNGSSQYLLERVKQAAGNSTRHRFYYLGIRNTPKSRKQLHGLSYDTFLFDFYKNYALQAGVREAVALYELFFTAPHGSVHYYGKDGIVLEQEESGLEHAQLLDAVMDYVLAGFAFAQAYGVEYSPETAVMRLQRLILAPTGEEAVRIGNLKNIDGFARTTGAAKHIAYVTPGQLQDNPQLEIYWVRGLLKRDDIPEQIKSAQAARLGIADPPREDGYHLEDAQSIRNYFRWRTAQAKLEEKRPSLSYEPGFSVVIPVYNTQDTQLTECIESVLGQSYRKFELLLVDDHSSWDNVVPLLKKYESHPNVHVIYRTVNGHISAATNDGIAAAQEEFLAFMDCDDILDPHALYEMAKKLNENPRLDFLYSDEDKVTEDGKIYHMPFFKPDWSPDLFHCMMYTNHLGVYRTSIAKEIGGLRGAFNGSQDYDFTLRFLERCGNRSVGHVAKILYHWRERRESVAFAMTSKNYAAQAARDAKEDWLKRNGIQAHMESIPGMSQHRVVYHVTGRPLVSIIIPSKDNPDLLFQCVDSVKQFCGYTNYEILVVDNGSSEENRNRIQAGLSDRNARYFYRREQFNFSRMCNRGARQAAGDYLLFLNDDVEAFEEEWLERMLGHAEQAHVGAVGAKLLYPGTTKIQHAGIGNAQCGPVHWFCGYEDERPYYFGLNWVDTNCIAVTGACLLVSASKFWDAGGFDETLPVAYNDVSLCFALYQAGYFNVVRNDAVLFHHESFSRGYDDAACEKTLRRSIELEKMYLKFPKLRGQDPFVNFNLCAMGEVLQLNGPYERPLPCDLSGAVVKGCGNIDGITVTDHIRVIGWSFLDQEKEEDGMERYVVFQDPYGNCFQLPVLPMLRQDVADCFGGGVRHRYAGFECVADSRGIRLDILPYRIGILTMGKGGSRYITWWQHAACRIQSQETGMSICRGKKAAVIEKHDQMSRVQWHVDVSRDAGAYYEISGYVFYIGDTHYLYQKSLILAEVKGPGGYELAVYDRERADVAAAFAKQHFLYRTGFACYIWKGALEEGVEYDVVIRLRNEVVAEDVQDIVTGLKVRGLGECDGGSDRPSGIKTDFY